MQSFSLKLSTIQMQPFLKALSKTASIHGSDSVRLLGCLLLSTTATLLAAAAVITKATEATINEEVGHSLAYQWLKLAGKSEQALLTNSPPASENLHILVSRTPPGVEFEKSNSHPWIIQHLQAHGINHELRKQPHCPNHLFGGYWLAATSAPSNQRLWIYAGADTALPWLWPGILSSGLLLGTCLGLLSFLQWQLKSPLQKMLRTLPAIPHGDFQAVPEEGISQLKELGRKINRLLDQLNQNQEVKRRFTLGLAHDFGTPLARISMRIEKLEEESNESSLISLELSKVRNDLTRLISLTHLLQDAAGEMNEPFERSLTDICDLCARICGSYNNPLVRASSGSSMACIDSRIIERALQNLIDNALLHGKPPVELSALRDGSTIVFKVEDSGDGLSSENILNMPHISPADDRQQSRRSGIGLTIVERCCVLHGGTMLLKRSKLGGLMVELRIPYNPVSA